MATTVPPAVTTTSTRSPPASTATARRLQVDGGAEGDGGDEADAPIEQSGRVAGAHLVDHEGAGPGRGPQAVDDGRVEPGEAGGEDGAVQRVVVAADEGEGPHRLGGQVGRLGEGAPGPGPALVRPVLDDGEQGVEGCCAGPARGPGVASPQRRPRAMPATPSAGTGRPRRRCVDVRATGRRRR